MAEPTNTPMPTAPPTRSNSPAPPLPGTITTTTTSGSSLASSPTAPRVPPPWPQAYSHSHSRAGSLTVPAHLSTLSLSTSTPTSNPKPIVLHLGDAVQHNPDTYPEFLSQFDVLQPSASERLRPAFAAALKERKWGDFAAIMRPSWGAGAGGGEMGDWDAELIDLLPESVRVFASAGAAYDGVDVKLLGEKGILYCNASPAAAEAVADFSVALILSTFRALPYCISSSSTSSVETFETARKVLRTKARNPRGRVLGIVGFGHVGQQVAHRCAAAFGMDITYYARTRVSGAIEAGLHARYCATLEALIRGADCVILCAPASAGRIINAESLRWFKPGSGLVNVARGGLVDEEALADALDDGRLESVALDVHEHEPRVNERLRAYGDTRALLTCHAAGGTLETFAGFEELAMRNVMAVLGGREAVSAVNLRWLR
ncbi:hypothetical protein F4808DRAFT_214269 [Astrocystis sublimbata]|nr:hypothetical protein F4808DRAFT_214269 [Astrocystis sublimbata]